METFNDWLTRRHGGELDESMVRREGDWPDWKKWLLTIGASVAVATPVVGVMAVRQHRYNTELKQIAEDPRMPTDQKKKAVEEVNVKYGYNPDGTHKDSSDPNYGAPSAINPGRMMNPVDRMTNPLNPFYGR